MRSFKALALATVASVLLAGSLQAQWIGQSKWAGVNGASSRYSSGAGGSGTQWNVYTSPYFAQFKVTSGSSTLLPPPAGSTTWGPVVDIFCVDFTHRANTSSGGYNAFFTNLASTSTDLAKTRLGASGLWKYLAAAFLAQKIRAEPSLGTVAARDMNGAIWQIISGNPIYRYTGTAWDRAGIDSWVSQATTGGGWASVNPADWVVVTDQASFNPDGSYNGNGSQEYLTQVTPEPATMLLLGTGLVVMLMAAGALRRPTV